MSENLSQSVSSQTVVCQNAQDKAFITPYLDSARNMLKEIEQKEKAKEEIKRIKKEKLRKKSEPNRGDILKSATKRAFDNTEYDNDGGKSQPLSTDDHFTASIKKKKRDIECLSLTVSSSDLDDYGTSDDDESSFVIDESYDISDVITIGGSDSDDIFSETSNEPSVYGDYSSNNKNNCSSGSSSSSSSSNGSSSISSSSCSSSSSSSSSSSQESVVFSKKKEKQTSIQAKIFSDYKENNKNGKKVIEIDSESDDEETDDGSEAHVVCFICGKYNTKKKFYLWISCTVCKNWFHKDCTHLWKKNIKDIEKDNFICRYH